MSRATGAQPQVDRGYVEWVYVHVRVQRSDQIDLKYVDAEIIEKLTGAFSGKYELS